MSRSCGFAAILLALALAAIPAADALAASAGNGVGDSHAEAVFVAEIVLLLFVGRSLGEVMRRIGQPPLMGQLLGGIILGPSVFGALWPMAQHAIFPTDAAQKNMINAVSQLGILLLLLLTGMETDLRLVKKVGGPAMLVALCGVAVPFACGVAAGEFLPDSLLPMGNRLVTALFLGTALSISSVKIVALVIQEMNFLRRALGQVILASAIIEDTVGWILIALIFGFAAQKQLNLIPILTTVGEVAAFMAVSLTLGRPAVFWLIRWANDTFRSDFPVVTMILIIMGVMALITDAIGVHTVLGAFVAGMLIGESPILTEHIQGELRGIITALFMPVFFGLSGLSADLTIFQHPQLLAITGGLILVASIGKFSGAFLGGELSRFSFKESVALGCAMNARGSTEVIVASVGLSMGALTQDLYTMIVAMAMATTLAMPPMLRRALSRIPMSKEEKERIDRENLDEHGFVSNIERLLLAVDESNVGKLASRLAGLIAGAKGAPVTLLNLQNSKSKKTEPEEKAAPSELTDEVKEGAKASAEVTKDDDAEPDPEKVAITSRTESKGQDAVSDEARKGYDLLMIGLENSRDKNGVFRKELTDVAGAFGGPLALLDCANGECPATFEEGDTLLVPVNGTDVSRRAAETAFALARPSGAKVHVLHVRRAARTPRTVQRGEEAVLREIKELGERYGVKAQTAVATSNAPETAILKEAAKCRLIVMGVSRRPGAELFFGNTAMALMEQYKGLILFVAS
jgi:Kef-type K+ transport system membrane component KefB/nucleotide-binding universal stress UspA family protein